MVVEQNFSNLSGNQVLRGAYDDAQQGLRFLNFSSLIPERFNRIELSYTVNDVTGVIYKFNGNIVATLTLTYSSGKLSSVERS